MYLNIFESNFIYVLRIACNSICIFLEGNTALCPTQQATVNYFSKNIP